MKIVKGREIPIPDLIKTGLATNFEKKRTALWETLTEKREKGKYTILAM